MTQQNPHLTPEQKAVLFDKATEAPFTGKLLHVTDEGTFVCANCGSKLFDSTAKYDSGCGWPSFDRAIPGSVAYHDDNSHSMTRTEVTCTTCGGHLGHVFPDGPTETTGDRYCINSLSLDFTKADHKS
ncbi:MAG: peptide-methionine (R)-S-oxide reductase MsrB [Candidatus Saccharimonas sp.]